MLTVLTLSAEMLIDIINMNFSASIHTFLHLKE